MMDQRELDANVKALTKSMAANEPPENALRLLETLKRDASPTEDMLRATRAGVWVGKLRSCKNKEIASAAAELVGKWKKLVEQEKKNKGASKMASPATASSPAISTTPAPSAAASSNGKKYEGDPEKRKFDVDGVDLNRTASKGRNQCIGLLYNGLAYRSLETPADVLAKAVAVEHAAHTEFKGETPDYKKKVKSLFTNLKNKSNPELGVSVMQGKVSPEKFVKMAEEELKSEDRRREDDEFEKENMKKAQVPMAKKSISDSLECGRCKKKMVSYSQAQTRSADEPMTTFCECMNCGKRWKFS